MYHKWWGGEVYISDCVLPCGSLWVCNGALWSGRAAATLVGRLSGAVIRNFLMVILRLAKPLWYGGHADVRGGSRVSPLPLLPTSLSLHEPLERKRKPGKAQEISILGSKASSHHIACGFLSEMLGHLPRFRISRALFRPGSLPLSRTTVRKRASSKVGAGTTTPWNTRPSLATTQKLKFKMQLRDWQDPYCEENSIFTQSSIHWVRKTVFIGKHVCSWWLLQVKQYHTLNLDLAQAAQKALDGRGQQLAVSETRTGTDYGL